MKSAGKSAYKSDQFFYEDYNDHSDSPIPAKILFNPIATLIQSWQQSLRNKDEDVEIDKKQNLLLDRLMTSQKSRKKKSPIRNLVALRLDPETQKELKDLERINQESQFERINLQKHARNDVLYESQDETFMEIYQGMLWDFRKIQSLQKDLEYELESLEHMNSIVVRDQNPEEIQSQMEQRLKKSQLSLDLLDETLNKIVSQCKKAEQHNNKLNESNVKLIMSLKDKNAQLAQREAREKQKDEERFIFKRKLDEIDEKMSFDKLQCIIIKMQFGESSLLRYGSRLVQSEYDKWAFSEGTATKWPYNVDIIEALDLKIFAITLLIPMARFILNDFSYQARVYRVLYGFHQRMSEDEVHCCVSLIRKRIEKHYLEKRLPNLTECIKNTVSSKRKKLIFICKEEAFEVIMKELLTEMANFSNPLMCIFSIKHENSDNLFENTSFRMSKIHIEYVFDQVGVNTVIDVLFCPFEKIMAADVVAVKKKMQRFESAFWWFDIPKGIHVGRIEQIKSVHEALKKIRKQHI